MEILEVKTRCFNPEVDTEFFEPFYEVKMNINLESIAMASGMEYEGAKILGVEFLEQLLRKLKYD